MGKLAELYVDIIGNAAPLYSTLSTVKNTLASVGSTVAAAAGPIGAAIAPPRDTVIV